MSIKVIYPTKGRIFIYDILNRIIAQKEFNNFYSRNIGDVYLFKNNASQIIVTYEFNLADIIAGNCQKIEIPLLNKNRNQINNLKLRYILSSELNHAITENEIDNSEILYSMNGNVVNGISVNLEAILLNCDLERYKAIHFILSSENDQADNISVFVANSNLSNIKIKLEELSAAPMTLRMTRNIKITNENTASEIEEFISSMYEQWKTDILEQPLQIREYNKRNTELNDSITFVSPITDISTNFPIENPNIESIQEPILNEFGSVIDEANRQESTGYFYTKIINGAYRVVDPQGYLHTIKNVSTPLPLLDTPNSIQISNSKKEAVDLFDTEHWKNQTQDIMLGAYFNCFEHYYNLITENKFCYNKMNRISKFPILDSWAREFELNSFERPKLCNILHPKFKERAHFKVKQILVKQPQRSSNVVAYTLDNEPVFDREDLLNCLYTQNITLNYRKEAAEVWLKNRLNSEDISIVDITEELNDEFLSFEFYVYSKIITDEIKAMDTNHMIFSPALQWYKFSEHKGFLQNNDNFFKVLNKFYDAMAFTHYSTYDILNEGLNNLKLNIPVFLNEFSLKGLDKPEFEDVLAGPAVATQKERAKYFEFIANQCLKHKNCIGYTWYQYSDIALTNGGIVNRGIVDPDGNPYPELYESMKKINSNAELLQQ